MDEFFKGTIGCAVLIVVAGIVGASLSGSERAFDLSPFLTVGSQPETAETPPTPVESPTAGSATPTASGGQLRQAAQASDARLTACPSGSQQPEATPLSLQRAQALQQAIANGTQFTDLIEIQAALGQPTCNFLRDERTRQYRYLAGTGGTIDALQVGDTPQVIVQFNGF